jgi:hypothetical protein
MHSIGNSNGKPGKGSKRKKAEEARRRAEEEKERKRQDRQQRQPANEPFPHKADAHSAGTDAAAFIEDAEGRYRVRREAFQARQGALGVLMHAGWWWAHNCVAHPILGLVPHRRSVWLHDWTSDHLNLRELPSRSPMPKISNRLGWLWHNCVAHPLIGMLPTSATFQHHDQSAERMGVDGWV